MAYPQRKRTRLQGYDYGTANYYYVTLCTKGKVPLFGTPGNLNALGKIAREDMERIPSHYRDVRVDTYVIMPNHIHVIVAVGCGKPGCSEEITLSSVIARYKAGVSRRIHQMDLSVEVWQKSFYDEIIRNERHYQAVWNYIVGNPQK